jgi:predicted RNase H-like HicB family nuclease
MKMKKNMKMKKKKVPLTSTKTGDCDYAASSSESFGFFAVGETREEVIANAREGIAMFLDIEEDEIDFEITDEDETS